MSLPGEILSLFRDLEQRLSSPKTRVATLLRVRPDRVEVSIDGGEAVACDWTQSFATEIANGPWLLEGRKVLVHLVEGVPTIVNTIVIGDKP